MLERVTLKEVRDVARDVKAFRFDERFEFKAGGQFVMVWLPGVGEKPFSLAREDTIVVKRVGPFTGRLFELDEGDHLWIRGPYGRGFEPKGKRIALVGGGYRDSTPPLRLRDAVREEIRENHAHLRRPLKGRAGADGRWRLRREIIVTTDDGSAGRKGFPTEVLADMKGEFDTVYACGPEPMLKAVLKVMDYENVQVSAERYMKCGIGVCGSCALGKYLVCRDGPVFDGFQLEGLL